MTTKTTTLAKSLHTITVLVAVANNERRRDRALEPITAVNMARLILGYADKPDPYGLVTKALAIVEREAAAELELERRRA